MRLYQVPSGARFFWPGTARQVGAYCLKCTWLVVYHIPAQRFAVLGPWTAVRDVELVHEDELPSEERVQRAHQQALGLFLFVIILLIAIAAVVSAVR